MSLLKRVYLVLLLLSIVLLVNAAIRENKAQLDTLDNILRRPEHRIVKRDDEEESGGFLGSLKSALWFVWDSIPSGAKKCKKYSPASCRG
uniref:Uncharacterized protein n=1 Tax=Acrobeloides nanus TaxID=290746 RepID=A0A914C2M1_9BILA